MKLRLSPINYFYIGAVLLWDPLQRAVLQVDGAGRSVVALTIFVGLLNAIVNRRLVERLIFASPMIFWSIWAAYSAVNQHLEGYHGDAAFFIYLVHVLLKPLLVMMVSARETVRNNASFVRALTVIFFVYTLSAITFLNGQGSGQDGRQLGELGNFGPLHAVFVVVFAAALFVYNRIKISAFLPLIFFSLFVIVQGGTRKAFAAVLIVLLCFLFSQLRVSFLRAVLSVFALASGYFVVDELLSNSVLGERFVQGVEVGAERNTTGIWLLDLLGDRAIFYLDGWSVFKDNMINGVGLKNYYFEGYGDLTLHSEYMVQLVEGGIIAFGLFSLFHVGLFRIVVGLVRSSETRSIGMVLFGGYAAILFIGFTAWIYQFPFYFCVFGVILAHSQLLRRDRSIPQGRVGAVRP